jgi:hypothetical protein
LKAKNTSNQLFAKARGVIAFGAHISNFVLLGTCLGLDGHQNLESLIGKYPDQWNWLTVRLNKHHLDRTPDMNVSDSSNLDPLAEERKKDAARGEGQIPDFMLGKCIDGKRTV